VTAPTEQQLRTEQPEDTHLVINRERLRALNSVAQRRVRRTEGGKDAVFPANDVAGFGSRIRVCDLWQAGLVVLGGDRHYQLTAAGARRAAEMNDQYDSQRIGGAPTTRPIPTRQP